MAFLPLTASEFLWRPGVWPPPLGAVVHPALNFGGGSTQIVSWGTNTSLDVDTHGTFLCWHFPTVLPNASLRHLWAKGVGASGGRWWLNSNGGANRLFMIRLRATTHCEVQALWTNVPFAAANTWMFTGCSFSTTANTDNKLYGGNLGNLATEVTTYHIQTAGSGTPTSLVGTTAATGNEPSGTTSWPGLIYWCGVWPFVLTPGQVQQAQRAALGFDLMPVGALLNAFLVNGTSTQLDQSSYQNRGVVSGATVAAGLPFNRERLRTVRWNPALTPSAGRIWQLAGEGGGLVGRPGRLVA